MARDIDELCYSGPPICFQFDTRAMKRISTLVLPLLIAASLTACKSKQNEAQDAAKDAPASTAQAPAEPGATAPAAPAAPATAAAPGAKFDLQSVPVTDKALPPFPYLATPTGLPEEHMTTTKDVEFDRVFVLAGEELRPVEGKVQKRIFNLYSLKWSALAAHRNYEAALKALGATRVDKVDPRDEQFIQRNGGNESAMLKKMGVDSLDSLEDPEVPGFEQWLIRTPSTNIWLTFSLKNGEVRILTVEEKAMQQQVQALPAAKLSSALKQDGHVALYLNFDTDSQVIRPDSLPAVDEVVKLMQGEPALKLRVEGHTDATGDAAHNRKLSLARAESVVQAITAKNISAQRLTAAGKGPDQPLADNGTEAGKAKNRRVELVRV
ncbi:OmpA family protein [Massilia sp. G4R7]|uniref:OmpA family protein n=1 Tax=Massilia phyllostachyos TaxID=2898585 RepID=A0ABS8QCN4_9BURK|nr:OmpA family protein [Massilia phyllostachyos]MCD2518782.1 OmpA family protein [Massilia phyllostachyos]